MRLLHFSDPAGPRALAGLSKDLSVARKSPFLNLTKNDTAGEVLEALGRSRSVVKMPPIDVAVHHASPDGH
jgi:hypothetical protein